MGKKIQKSICIFGANFMLDQVTRLEDEINSALDAQDIEHIHRMRVASRRLRNAFEHFKDCFPKKKSKTWQEDIRLITKSLGTARDLDIQIERLSQLYVESLDPQFKPGYQCLILRLKQRRVKAQNKVEKTLKKLQEGRALEKIHLGVEKLSVDTEDIYLYTPSLYQRAFTAINTTLEDFMSHAEFIQSPENVEELHAMRIAGKKLRYTIELFSPIYKQAMIPYVQVMKDIQDQLGNIHDDDIWVSWLPKFIIKEEARIENYFGNTGPLNRLLPGIEFLIEDRKNSRAKEYQSFLTTWQTLQDENAWNAIKEIINTPINVEAALQHLTVEEEFNPEMDIVEEEVLEEEEKEEEEKKEEEEDNTAEAEVTPPLDNEEKSTDAHNAWIHLDEPPSEP